jgi:F-type H+-transporting ATPase subunit b
MVLASLLLPDAEPAGQIEQIARTFGVDWPHLIAQTISFSIVCALLYWLAYRPVLRMLEARRQQIAHGLANAEKIRAELAETEAQRQAVLAAAHAQAAAIVEEARAAAARLETQETRRALAAAGHIVLEAQEATAREHTRMLADLRREVGRLVVQTTASVTGKVLTADDQRRLAEETARQLSA